ncbi:MAG TPA: hypothetical protein VGO47_06445 [Chlamydiales bacterium]|nr:hypothetical protein [Chlamydiales bacterium]
MTDNEKINLQAILMDFASEIAEVEHPSLGDKWFEQVAEAIRNI